MVYMPTWMGYIDGKCYHIWQHHGSYGCYQDMLFASLFLFFPSSWSRCQSETFDKHALESIKKPWNQGNSNNLAFNTEYLNEAMEPTSRIIQEAWPVARLRNSKDATWLIACILLNWLCVYPLVNKHNYGKSQCYPFLMGKSTISILWPFSIENC